MSDANLIASLEAAVVGNPGDVPLRVHLAGLLLAAGRTAEAVDHARRALAADPANAEARRIAGHQDFDWGAAEKGFEAVPVLAAGEDDEGPSPFNVENPGVTFADVGGMVEVKKRLNVAFLAPLRNPEMREMFGKSLRGGLLLYGPPGCGKTFVARATAGELGARFYSVGLSDVLDMWIGNSERNLHEIFELARRSAPCVLFLDEIDALGQKRSNLRNSGMRTTVNQLLAELDPVDNRNEGVFVLGATNHPWDVDTALRRPGRLDRMLLVLPPDEPARQAILEYHLRGRPVEGVPVGEIAARTDGFSGADLMHLCETATEHAMEESIARGVPRPIGPGDFKRALKAVRPSTAAWFHTAKNHAMFANEGGLYDDLLAYLRAKKFV